MRSSQQTFLIVVVALSMVLGAFSGAIGAWYASLILPEWFVPLAQQDISANAPVVALSEEEERTILGLLEEEQATISVVLQVTPAVVSIIIEKELPTYVYPFGIPTGEFERYEVGGGSGFFVREDGYILTNRHVVQDPQASYVVVTDDQQEFPATVVAKDVFLDLAILKVEGRGFPVVQLGDSDRIQVGATVIAIGNTLSEFPNTVTKGIISGIDRRLVAGDHLGQEEVIEEAIQTDAAISEGNSGGPLINLVGEVIGVNTAVSNGGTGSSLGFAIPVNAATSLLEDIFAHGRIVRPWLGVRYQTIDADVQDAYDLSVSQGAWIVAPSDPNQPTVIPGSPAEKAGLKPGDIITAVNEEALGQKNSLSEVLNGFEPGETVALNVLRGSETLTIQILLEELTPEALE